MAANVPWKVSGKAQRATGILLPKSHFVPISPTGGSSKVVDCVREMSVHVLNTEFRKGGILLRL